MLRAVSSLVGGLTGGHLPAFSSIYSNLPAKSPSVRQSPAAGQSETPAQNGQSHPQEDAEEPRRRLTFTPVRTPLRECENNTTATNSTATQSSGGGGEWGEGKGKRKMVSVEDEDVAEDQPVTTAVAPAVGGSSEGPRLKTGQSAEEDETTKRQRVSIASRGEGSFQQWSRVEEEVEGNGDRGGVPLRGSHNGVPSSVSTASQPPVGSKRKMHPLIHVLNDMGTTTTTAAASVEGVDDRSPPSKLPRPSASPAFALPGASITAAAAARGTRVPVGLPPLLRRGPAPPPGVRRVAMHRNGALRGTRRRGSQQRSLALNFPRLLPSSIQQPLDQPPFASDDAPEFEEMDVSYVSAGLRVVAPPPPPAELNPPTTSAPGFSLTPSLLNTSTTTTGKDQSDTPKEAVPSLLEAALGDLDQDKRGGGSRKSKSRNAGGTGGSSGGTASASTSLNLSVPPSTSSTTPGATPPIVFGSTPANQASTTAPAATVGSTAGSTFAFGSAAVAAPAPAGTSATPSTAGSSTFAFGSTAVGATPGAATATIPAPVTTSSTIPSFSFGSAAAPAASSTPGSGIGFGSTAPAALSFGAAAPAGPAMVFGGGGASSAAASAPHVFGASQAAPPADSGAPGMGLLFSAGASSNPAQQGKARRAVRRPKR